MSSSSAAAFSARPRFSTSVGQLCVHCSFYDAVLAVYSPPPPPPPPPSPSTEDPFFFTSILFFDLGTAISLSVNMRGLLLPAANQLHLGPFLAPSQHNLLEEVLSNCTHKLADGSTQPNNATAPPAAKGVEEALPQPPAVNRRKSLAAITASSLLFIINPGQDSIFLSPSCSTVTKHCISFFLLRLYILHFYFTQNTQKHTKKKKEKLGKEQRVPSAYNRFIKWGSGIKSATQVGKRFNGCCLVLQRRNQRIKQGTDITQGKPSAQLLKTERTLSFGLSEQANGVRPPDGFFAALRRRPDVWCRAVLSIQRFSFVSASEQLLSFNNLVRELLFCDLGFSSCAAFAFLFLSFSVCVSRFPCRGKGKGLLSSVSDKK
ncbi:hypothetical protein HPP92_025620 [Vanilla planifolia]|uniref:Uncharacterized protein n=1 Tax=Vanilla planifolia TaxID=51239 RepID=A0A835PIS4_VANPL|nr:hypothetical protein HPP92_025620 [Vanilla planifolia]